MGIRTSASLEVHDVQTLPFEPEMYLETGLAELLVHIPMELHGLGMCSDLEAPQQLKRDRRCPQIRHFARDVTRPCDAQRFVLIHPGDGACTGSLDHGDRARSVVDEVLADVHGAVARADDDDAFTCVRCAAGKASRVQGLSSEQLHVRDSWDARSSRRSGGNDDVRRTEVDLDTVADDCDVPGLRLRTVRRWLFEFGFHPDDKVLDERVVFDPICELMSRRKGGPICGEGLIEDWGKQQVSRVNSSNKPYSQLWCPFGV